MQLIAPWHVGKPDHLTNLLILLQGSGLYRGVRLASGQDLFSHQLLIDPQFVIPQALALSKSGSLQVNSQNSIPKDIKMKVARGICITRTSLKSDALNLLIVYPPRCTIEYPFFNSMC